MSIIFSWNNLKSQELPLFTYVGHVTAETKVWSCWRQFLMWITLIVKVFDLLRLPKCICIILNYCTCFIHFIIFCDPECVFGMDRDWISTLRKSVFTSRDSSFCPMMNCWRFFLRQKILQGYMSLWPSYCMANNVVSCLIHMNVCLYFNPALCLKWDLKAVFSWLW